MHKLANAVNSENSQVVTSQFSAVVGPDRSSKDEKESKAVTFDVTKSPVDSHGVVSGESESEREEAELVAQSEEAQASSVSDSEPTDSESNSPASEISMEEEFNADVVYSYEAETKVAEEIQSVADAMDASPGGFLDVFFAQVGGVAGGSVGGVGTAVATDAVVGAAVGQMAGTAAAAGTVSTATVAAAGVGVAAAAGGGGGGGSESTSSQTGSGSSSTVALLSSYSDEVAQSNSFDLYQFDISGGQVTAVREYENGRWVNDPISAYETYQVSGSDVVKTENYGSYVETTRYSDNDGDGVFIESLSSISSGLNASVSSSLRSSYYEGEDDDDYDGRYNDDDDGRYLTGILDDDNNDDLFERGESLDLYRFDISNGQINGVQEFDDGRWKNEGIDRDESYTLSGGDVIKREYDDGYLELTVYRDSDGDGVFSELSKSYEFIA